MSLIQGFLVYFVTLFFNLLEIGVFIHVLMSWFARGRTPLGGMVDQVIAPLLRPFAWARLGGFSLSPILLLFAIYGVRSGLLHLLALLPA